MIRASVALTAILWAMAGCGSMGDSAPPSWRRPGPAATGPLERQIVPDDGFRANLATFRAAQRDLPASRPAHTT